MSHTTDVLRATDDMIVRGAETSLAVYYRIGQKITVSHRGRDRWLCHTCSGQDRYQNSEHKGCAHIQRAEQWAADHPTEAGA
jgi:hypothetical protein